MSDYTLFLNPLLQAFTTDAPTPFYSRYSDAFNTTSIFGVDQKKVKSILLDLAETYVFTPGDLSLADGCIIVAKVVGSARLKVTGTDLGATVTGYLPTYGTDIFPGYINLSTYNATAFEFLGQADGTVIELFLGYAGGAVGFTGTFVFVFNTGFAASQSVTINYSKVGRQVVLDFPSFAATGATPGLNSVTGSAAIPTNLWPEIITGTLDNPALVSVDGATTQTGLFDLGSNGILHIYKTVTAATAFTNGATIGWSRFTTSYVTAS